jgi:hypothetical protein
VHRTSARSGVEVALELSWVLVVAAVIDGDSLPELDRARCPAGPKAVCNAPAVVTPRPPARNSRLLKELAMMAPIS